MNINQIKETLGVKTLSFEPQLDQDGVKTDWSGSWDNLNRVQVVSHNDVLAVAGTSATLFLRSTTNYSKESGEAYIKHVLINRPNAEITATF